MTTESFGVSIQFDINCDQAPDLQDYPILQDALNSVIRAFFKATDEWVVSEMVVKENCFGLQPGPVVIRNHEVSN